MAFTYPIIETQIRLIRALQKGYVEALEAGDWQAADYRCAHLNKLCEGLHYLSQLIEKENTIPDAVTPRSVKSSNSWVNTIRSNGTPPVLTQAADTADKGSSSPLPPEPKRYDWGNSAPAKEQPPIDEVWH